MLPRDTGKATRGAIVERMKGTTFLHPLVRFGFTEEERRKAEQARAYGADGATPRSGGRADGEEAGDGKDEAEIPEPLEDADDDGEAAPMPPPGFDHRSEAHDA